VVDHACDRCVICGLTNWDCWCPEEDKEIARAIVQISKLATELKAVRDAGFTEQALRYPRSEKGLIALCAFNNIKPEFAPRGWRYWPNAAMRDAWERVIAALV